MRRRAILLTLLGVAFLVRGTAAADNVVISGSVLYEGKPVSGAAVSVLGSSTKSGADGRFRVEGVPALHQIGFRHFRRAKDGVLEYQDVITGTPFLVVAAIAEREEKAFNGLSSLRVELGAVTVVTSGNVGKPVSIALKPVTDWEVLCRRCHPASPATTPGIRTRPAKKDIPKPNVTKELYLVHRFQDSHPSGFDYTETSGRGQKKTAFAEKVTDLPLAEGKRVDCRTCHTFHQAGEVPSYVRAEFRGKNDLCQRCHR